MSSPVVTAISQIATDWAALTPPDRTSITYAENVGRRKMTGTAGDRKFWFRPPTRTEVLAQRGTSWSIVEWSVVSELRLSQAGRNLDDLADIATNESNLLMRAVEKRESWPSGVIAVITDDAVTDFEGESENGDLLVSMFFRIQTQETD